MVQQAIRSYYVISILASLGIALHSATYVTFLMRQGSLNLFEVNLVNVAFFATVALMEVPTGVFADVFGRRFSFLVSCVLIAAGLFVYGASTGFWGFVLAEIILAIGGTFSSGAFEAWIVDQLDHRGFTESFDKLFSRSAVFARVASMGGAVFGVLIFDHSMALPWHIGGVVYLVTGFVAWRVMREDYFTRRVVSWRNHFRAMRETMRSGVALARKSSVVRFVTILVLVQAFAVQAPNMQWQPFFGKFFTSQLGQGLIWVGVGIATILGALLAPRLRRAFGDERRTLVVLQIATGAGIAFVPVLAGSLAPAVAMYLAHEVARGAFDPTKDAYLARGITSSAERATILSFQSLFKYTGGALGLAASGWIAESVSLGAGWGFSGIVLVIAGVVLWRERK